MTKTIFTLALTLSSTLTLAQTMDHANMHHGEMKHAEMDHSEMAHKMDHSAMMNMPGMSKVGMPAQGAKPDKVVHVILADDMSITFKKQVTIEPNDVVQFVVMNTGNQPHEFAIGSKDELAAHRKMMAQMKGMPHDTNSSIIVQPKKARQFVWHFHGDNNIEIACNLDDHANAGMIKTLTL